MFIECTLRMSAAVLTCAVQIVSFWKSDDLKPGSRSGGAGSRGSCLAARGSERNVCVLLLDVLSRIRRRDVVVPSATVWRGGAQVPSGVDNLSPHLVANLTAAAVAVVVVVRVDPALVPAISTLKKSGPTEQTKVTPSVHHAVEINKMTFGNEACDSTEYLANKENDNVKQVIFRFSPPNFSVCWKAQWESHRRSLQMEERLCEDQIPLSVCHIVAARKPFIG